MTIKLNDLKFDLSTNSSGHSSGSGLGGNAAEYLFVLSRVSDLLIENDFDQINFLERDDKTMITCGTTTKLFQLRKELSHYCFDKLAESNLSFKDLFSFLEKDENSFEKTSDLFALKQCMKLSANVYTTISKKVFDDSEVKKLFELEKEKIHQKYERIYGICIAKDATAHSLKIKYPHLVSQINYFYPCITSQVRDVSIKLDQSRSDFKSNFLGEELELIKEIMKFPNYIGGLCIRIHIGIDKIIELDLDNLLIDYYKI